MLKAKRIKLDGKGPFSRINIATTSLGMKAYLDPGLAAEVAQQIARNPDALKKGKGK